MTPDLAALLADPAHVADVPAEAIAWVLTEVTAQEARLGAVKAILAARLAVPVPPPTNGRPEPEVIEDVEEVARIVRRSVSWVRKEGHKLPGFSQPGGKGTRVAWNRAALTAWVCGGAACR